MATSDVRRVAYPTQQGEDARTLVKDHREAEAEKTAPGGEQKD